MREVFRGGAVLLATITMGMMSGVFLLYAHTMLSEENHATSASSHGVGIAQPYMAGPSGDAYFANSRSHAKRPAGGSTDRLSSFRRVTVLACAPHRFAA